MGGYCLRTDYDTFGVNHIVVGVEKIEDVDKAVLFLRDKNIKFLFGTVRYRSEFYSKLSMSDQRNNTITLW